MCSKQSINAWLVFTSTTFRNTLNLSSCTQIQVCPLFFKHRSSLVVWTDRKKGYLGMKIGQCSFFSLFNLSRLMSILGGGHSGFILGHLSSDKPAKPVFVKCDPPHCTFAPWQNAPRWTPAPASLCAVCMLSCYLSGFPPNRPVSSRRPEPTTLMRIVVNSSGWTSHQHRCSQP